MVRSTPGHTRRAAMLLPLAMALVAGAATADAQQRVEATTTRRVQRGDDDSSERVVRRLKARADSLARLYGDDDALTGAERQRVGEELDRTVDELERAVAAMQTGVLRVPLPPLASARAAQAMSRALMPSAPTSGPRGWLGIVVNGVAREPRVERGELIVHYLTYPEILSVEPSSPAERAGLVPGDTLIAYDGRDVRDVDISMTRLLKPNARVLVRIGRDGTVRDVPVTIADAPSRIQMRRDDMDGTISIERSQGAMALAPGFPRSPMSPAPVAPPAGMRRALVGTTAPVAPMTPAPAATGGLAGAQMGTLSASWARLTGVAHGVLVLRAPAGSPAAESGLRDADVIVQAAGREVGTLSQLRDLMATAWENGERSIAIRFVRERKTRNGTLRW